MSVSLLTFSDIEWPFPTDFYPRDAMLAQVFARATCPFVHLSVRLSHAGIVSKRRDFSLSGSPTILVFWRQISSQNSKGSPRASNQGRVGKNGRS